MSKPIPESAFYSIPANASPGKCRGKDCTEPIYFVKTPKGRLCPVSCDADGTWVPMPGLPGRGVSHYYTCPNAKQFGKGAQK